MQVQDCTEHDVDRLEDHLPSPGLNRFHHIRYQRQLQGLSAFLVARLDGTPVGCGEILWSGCGDAGVRERFPACPELSGLMVAPQRRSQGIGTTIIRTAEARVADRGFRWIGLGVDDQNERAAALYLRLGYRDLDVRYVDRYPYLDETGTWQQAADPCRFLVKAF
jgi:ribosomal protein S18 acetylase RimI-like enzyme